MSIKLAKLLVNAHKHNLTKFVLQQRDFYIKQRENERKSDKNQETGRETERQTQRDRERHTHTETERDTHTGRQRERHTHTHKHRETEREDALMPVTVCVMFVIPWQNDQTGQ